MEESEKIKDVESSEAKLRGDVIIAKYLLDSMKKKQEVIYTISLYHCLYITIQGVDENYQWVLTQLKVKDMTVHKLVHIITNYIIFNLGYCDDTMAYSIKEVYNNYR